MEKKYELSNITMVNDHGVTLYRIRALKDFETWTHRLVKAGDFGGWVEGEKNLAQRGKCWIFDDAQVFENANLSGNSYIFGAAKVHGRACLSGDIAVYGLAEIHGNAILRGRMDIGHLADIPSTEHVISIGPIGSRHDTTTFYRSSDNDIWVSCGCFNGNISKFEKTVKAIHGDNKFGKEYMHAIQFARDYFGLNSSKWSPSKVCRIIRSWKERLEKKK